MNTRNMYLSLSGNWQLKWANDVPIEPELDLRPQRMVSESTGIFVIQEIKAHTGKYVGILQNPFRGLEAKPYLLFELFLNIIPMAWDLQYAKRSDG